MRFTPDGRGLIFMRAEDATPGQDFWMLDLKTMNTRRLTRLTDRAAMCTFDITPDGKQIIFDRLRENSAVILINRQGGRQVRAGRFRMLVHWRGRRTTEVPRALTSHLSA